MKTFLILMILSNFQVTTALARPATTIKIPETSQFTPPGREPLPLFLRADVSRDIPNQGVTGGALSVGWMGDYFFFDLGAGYYYTNYGAIHVPQTGIKQDDTYFSPQSELGRMRKPTDQGHIVTIGPGIGTLFKWFNSKKWTEFARFGFTYASFADDVNGVSLGGALASFQGGVGYQFGKMMIAPGFSWNLGYLRRFIDDYTGIPKDTFLPIQWWSLQLGVYFWL